MKELLDTPQRNEKSRAFKELYSRVYDGMRREKIERLRKHREPTEYEITQRCFEDDLEPQVRRALEILSQKGYRTTESGFYIYGDREKDSPSFLTQYITGFFDVGDETEKKLKEIGVKISRRENDYPRLSNADFDPRESTITTIEFMLPEPDIEAITSQWVKIAELLPVVSEDKRVVCDKKRLETNRIMLEVEERRDRDRYRIW
ncbi:MAG: hypothetical protein ABSE18_01015 [Minisyncoccia bacterium]